MLKSEVNEADSKLSKESTDSTTLATSVDEAMTGSAHTSPNDIVIKSESGESDSKFLSNNMSSKTTIHHDKDDKKELLHPVKVEGDQPCEKTFDQKHPLPKMSTEEVTLKREEATLKPEEATLKPEEATFKSEELTIKSEEAQTPIALIQAEPTTPQNAPKTSTILQIYLKQHRPTGLQASLEQYFAALAERFQEPCYNKKQHKHETFAQAFLRELVVVKHTSNELDKFALECKLGLTDILAKLRQKAFISAEFAKKSSIEMILRQVRNPVWRFSAFARVFAIGLYARFERQNWGEKTVAPPTPEGSSKQQRKRKRGTSSKDVVAVKEKKAKVDKMHFQKPIPEKDDPIFGVDGPMHGTLIKYNTVDPHNITKSIVLNPEITQINSKVYGHNGIAIGTIFLRQMAALAKGAHGSSQAGIAGTADDGAFSIIVTGAYNSLESDDLTRFEYCATGSMDNTFPNTIIESQGLKAMRASLSSKKPVRVLRGENDKFRYAPKFGLRYDGLYMVVAEKHKYNPKGGLFAAFVLERMEDQGRVNLSRPNPEDWEKYQELKKRLE